LKKIYFELQAAVIMTLLFFSCGSGNIHEPLPEGFPSDSIVKVEEWQNIEGDSPGQLLRLGADFPSVSFLLISGEINSQFKSGFYSHVLNQEIIDSLKQAVARFAPDFLIQIGTFPESDQFDCPVYRFSIMDEGSAEPLEGLSFIRKSAPGFSPDNASFLILPPSEFSFEMSGEDILLDFLYPVIFTSGELQEVAGYKGGKGEWLYIVSTPPITRYPYTFRMITIDDRQIMNIDGGRLIPDIDSAVSSMNDLYLTLRDEIVPSIMMNYRIIRKKAEIMAEYQAALELSRIAGEESGALPDEIYKRASELWMKKAPEDFNQMIRTLGTDQPPPDNRIQIDLVSGRWRSLL